MLGLVYRLVYRLGLDYNLGKIYKIGCYLELRLGLGFGSELVSR